MVVAERAESLRMKSRPTPAASALLHRVRPYIGHLEPVVMNLADAKRCKVYAEPSKQPPEAPLASTLINA